MSQPSSPEPQKRGPPSTSSDGLQLSETCCEHGILSSPTVQHHHQHFQCKCNLEKPTTESTNAEISSSNPHCHHHHVASPINQSVHVHVHAQPKNAAQCGCYHKESAEPISTADVHERESASSRKIDDDNRIEVSPLPPALPPRPPPRPRLGDGSFGTLRRAGSRSRIASNPARGIRKYVFWCCICGGASTILGALFLAVYFFLRSYTSTLGYFETIPTFIPASMLMLTGLCVISLARRKNRYSYLIKVCGLCCLVCALTCVLVTITTTVIHMNRLQTLRECVYTQKTRTCTCYSVLLETHTTTEEGMRYIFDSTPDCEVIHGALYTCLRAMFGLSVSGILVCIFSCMLVYQLLSHEKKKMYWEQLELRCRSFYQQQGAPASTHGSMRGPPLQPATYCSCCEECRYPPIIVGPQVYPWNGHRASDRFWTPGRVGNFYSPNPGEENTNQTGEPRERTASGWSWRRLPWNRNSANQSNTDNQRENSYQGVPSSADSQYGFSNQSGGENSIPVSNSTGSYSVLDHRPVGGVYVWGPPPPYSNPNSPARRPINSPARYHHVHHHIHSHDSNCQMSDSNQFTSNQELQLRRNRPPPSNKDNYENTADNELQASNDNSESTDTSSSQDRIPHTLPVRKIKKRVDVASVKSVAPIPNPRTNVKQVFNSNYPEDTQKLEEEPSYHEPNLPDTNKVINSENQNCRFLPRLQGVENAAFQKQENSPVKAEPTESEVYFADVSSCCNISVRNDGQDSSLYDEALESQKSRLISLHCVHKQNCSKEMSNTNKILQTFQENISSSTVTEDEEYLAHRMGKRQMSTRSRLPFPLPGTDELKLIDNNPSDICGLPKDLSQNSLCSSVKTPMTETTDDGLSPISPSFPNTECCLGYYPEKLANVEALPQRSALKTFSNSSLNEFLAPDAQYEIIQEQNNANPRHNYDSSNLTNTISGLNNFGQNYMQSNFCKSYVPNNNPQNVPPKSLNLGLPSSRRNIGSNISTLIQNLGVNHVGLLYSDSKCSENEELQGQGSHSDGTIDSGWQSGSEKIEHKVDGVSESNTHKSVNV